MSFWAFMPEWRGRWESYPWLFMALRPLDSPVGSISLAGDSSRCGSGKGESLPLLSRGDVVSRRTCILRPSAASSGGIVFPSFRVPSGSRRLGPAERGWG